MSHDMHPNFNFKLGRENLKTTNTFPFPPRMYATIGVLYANVL